MDRTFRQQHLRHLFDHDRVYDGGRDGRVTQDVLFDAGRVDHRRIKVEQRVAVREVERRVRVYLSPNEHVFGGQADLFVAVANVGANGGHYLFFRKVDLRVQVGDAEFAAASAARGHLYHAEGSALVGHEQRLTLLRVADLDLAQQFFAVNRLAEDRHRVLRFAAAFDHAIDAEFVE